MNGNIITIILIFSILLAISPAVNAAAPVAKFSGSPASGNAPLNVTFTDRSTGSPTGWAWYFGDETYRRPWTEMNASPGWPARNVFSSVAMPDGTILLMGGSSTEGFKNDTWKSTDKGRTWALVNGSSGWSARYGPTSVVMPDGTIVLFGGSSRLNEYLNDVWQSPDQGATWICVNTSTGWTPRDGVVAAVSGGRIIIAGGTYYGGYTQFGDVWQSDDKGVTWTRMTANAEWGKRYGHSLLAMPDGSIVLIGGFSFSEGGLKNDTWRSTNNGATWTLLNTHAGWRARIEQSGVVMPDGSIILMGGHSPLGMKDSYYNDVWRSTNNGVTWTMVNASAGWTPRFTHTSVALPDGSIVLMGGYNDTPYLNDVWRFQPTGSLQKSPSHTYTRPGRYTVSLQVYNSTGYNSTRKIQYINVSSAPAPTVAAVDPLSGKLTKLVSITNLSGTGFRAGAKVYLTKAGSSAIPATNVSVVSPAKITCTFKIPFTVPVGFWNIRVTNPDKKSGSRVNAFLVKSPTPPTITGITPDSGIRGTTVQITYLAGNGFILNPKPAVQLLKNTSRITATNVTVINPNRMTCTFTISPYAPVGSWDVRVTNGDGQYGLKAGGFTVNT